MDKLLSFVSRRRWELVLLLAIVVGFHLLPEPQARAAFAGAALLAGVVRNTDEIIRYLIAQGFLDAAGGLKVNVVAKTANYQILSASDPSGTLFTTRGAGGAVTFTLPAVAPALAGVFYDFDGVANQTIGVAAAAGTVVTFNNAAATSVTASTAGGKIGAHFRAICDGTSWHVIGDVVGVTYTVA